VYLLFLAGIVAFIMAYKVAISETVKTRKNLADIREKLDLIELAPKSIAYYENRIESVNLKLGDSKCDPTDFQKDILNRISTYCAQNALVLKDFPQIHVFHKQDYQFLTGFASIEGSFIPLLKLLHELETSPIHGRIVSVGFFSYEDRRLKMKKLTMSVYIQTIKQMDDESNE